PSDHPQPEVREAATTSGEYKNAAASSQPMACAKPSVAENTPKAPETPPMDVTPTRGMPTTGVLIPPPRHPVSGRRGDRGRRRRQRHGDGALPGRGVAALGGLLDDVAVARPGDRPQTKVRSFQVP